MKHYYKILLFGFIFFNSCKNFNDQKIQLRNPDYIDLLSPSIDICITGKEELNYFVRITNDESVIDTFTIKSSNEKNFIKPKIDFSRLKDKLPLLAYELIKSSQINLNITALNKKNRISIDTIIKLKVRIPPIAFISSVDGTNFSSTSFDKLKEYEQKIKAKYLNSNWIDVKKAAILTDLIFSKTLHPTVSIDELTVPIIKRTDKIKIRILTDTVYEYTAIGRYPSQNNKDYSDIDFDKEIKETMANDLSKIKSDWRGLKDGNQFVLEDEIEARYSGLVSLYVINIDKNGSYSYSEVGNFLVDETAPMFNNYKYGTFKGNARYEGLLCLGTERFYGWNPYTVPFLGQVYGDIKEVYVDGKRIPFSVGSELYFKKSVYLDGGYNRISVKLIDHKGNSAEYFIPVTIESLDKTEINIEN